ncbi:unnamed protein product [Alternaria alternata]
MSGLEIAAGVIGITDFGLRGIKGLYDFFQDLQDARENLPQIWHELSCIQSNVVSLKFLSEADEDTLKEVRATGITQGMNDCGSACDKLNRQLIRWTERGVDSFTGKLNFKLHSAQIEKNRVRLWATARMLDMTVGILTLYDNFFIIKRYANYLARKLVHKSEAERAAEISALTQAMDCWKRQAGQERERVSLSLQGLEDSEDSGVIDELDEEESVLKTFIDRSGQTAEQLQAVKLNQTFKGINSDDSEVKLGMPASVVDKVARQSITDVTSKNKSKVTVGIW